MGGNRRPTAGEDGGLGELGPCAFRIALVLSEFRRKDVGGKEGAVRVEEG
jgi:hypothetical protein